MDAFIFNRFCGSACIFEYCEGRIEIIRANGKYARTIGGPDCTTEYALSMDWAEHMDQSAGQTVRAAILQAIETGDDVTFEAAYHGLPGGAGLTYLRTSLRLLARIQGRYLLFSSNENITQQRQAEQRQRDAEQKKLAAADQVQLLSSMAQSPGGFDLEAQRLELLEMLPVALEAMMASSTDFSFVKDRELRYVCCSRATAELAGLEREADVIGKTDYDIFTPSQADAYTADDRRVMRSGRSLLNHIESIPSRDGKAHYGSTSKYLLHDAAGNVIGLYGVCRDVTRSREANSQLALLTESIPGGLASFTYQDGVCRLTYFNDGFCRLFGYDREEYQALSLQSPMGRVFTEDLPVLQQALDAMLRDGTEVDCTYRIHTRDGGYRWVSHRGAIADRQGDVVTVNGVLFDVTSEHEANDSLHISREEYRLAMELSGNILCRYNIPRKKLFLSPDAAAAFHCPEIIENMPDCLDGMNRLNADGQTVCQDFFAAIRSGASTGSVTFQLRVDQSWRWLQANYSTIYSGGGAPVSAVISVNDVTQQLEKETIYQKWLQSLSARDPASYTLYRCNLSKETLSQLIEGTLLRISFSPEAVTFNMRTAEYVQQFVYAEDQDRYRTLMDSDALLAGHCRGRCSETLEYREVLPQGGVRWLRLSVDLVERPGSRDVEAYIMYEDIDRAKQEELLTLQRAEADPLTGLLNHAAFAAKTDQRLQAGPADGQHALLMLDVDGFKLVNDVFGHAAGDQALIDIANVLRQALRRDDLLCRLGGDEFVALLCDIPGSDTAQAKGKRICSQLRRVFSSAVRISASVGIAMYPQDGVCFADLYQKADAALYRVKGIGKDGCALYQDQGAETPAGDATPDAPPTPDD